MNDGIDGPAQDLNIDRSLTYHTVNALPTKLWGSGAGGSVMKLNTKSRHDTLQNSMISGSTVEIMLD